jgi:hypothetical protein
MYVLSASDRDLELKQQRSTVLIGKIKKIVVQSILMGLYYVKTLIKIFYIAHADV